MKNAELCNYKIVTEICLILFIQIRMFWNMFSAFTFGQSDLDSPMPFWKRSFPPLPIKKSVQFEPGLAFPKILSSSTLSLSKWFAFNSMRCQRVFVEIFFGLFPNRIQNDDRRHGGWRVAVVADFQRRRRRQRRHRRSVHPSHETGVEQKCVETSKCRQLEVWNTIFASCCPF